MSGKVRSGGLVLLVAGVAVVGLLLLRDDDDRGPRADRGPVAAVHHSPMRNGSIIHSADGGLWVGGRRPSRAMPDSDWNAVDQESGSFLYVTASGRVEVVGEDGPVAAFDCHPPAVCGAVRPSAPAFGPGPDEVTLPTEGVSRSLRVVAFDGAVRDKLDLSPAVTESAGRDPGRDLVDLAWSPDGSRLAVSTRINACCVTAEGQPIPDAQPELWIFERHGGKPRLLYSGRPAYGDAGIGEFQDLAWAPDGRSLGLILTIGWVHESEARSAAWPPRLVVLRLPPAQPMRADTLHVYDDCDCLRGLTFESVYGPFFDFAWSPDGTRIAVTGDRRITEISAEDGRVLTRHPRKDARGPLAWLRKR